MKRTLSLLCVVAVLGVACQRRPPLAVSIPDGGLFRDAEIAFWSGDYREAVALYEQILAGPSTAVRERAMFRMVLIQELQGASPELGPQDPTYRQRLATEYSSSPLNAEIDTTLRILSELASLRSERERQVNEFQRLSAELEQVRDERATIQGELNQAAAEVERIGAERAALDDVLRGALSVASEPDQASAVTASGDVESGLREDLDRLSEDLRRLMDDYRGTLMASEAELMLDLLSEIQQLRLAQTNERERIDGLLLEVDILSEELEKLREADLRRRLPD